MPHDIKTLQQWIEIVAWIAAICTTSVPVIYATFFPWRARAIGKLIMVQAISFAVLMDTVILGVLWHPKSILLVFWIDALVFTAIAGSTLAVAIFMVKVYYSNRKGNE